MAKINKGNTNISNDMFKINEKRYADNLEALDKELSFKMKELEFFKKEAQLKKGKHGLINPTYKYEDTHAWTEYMEEINAYSTQIKVAEKQKMIDKMTEMAMVETVRLKLIREGIPAWEGNYTNEKLLEGYDKLN